MREGYVLFQGVSAGGASRIYYQAGGGSRASELVRWSDLGGDLSQPSVSPDGRGVVFVGTEQADLLVRHTETANIRNLTNTAGHEVAPRISRAGDTVYFQRQSVQGWDVWSVPFAGGVETLVAGGPGDQLRPNPAADGWVVWFDVQGDACTVVAGRGAERRVLAADVRLPLRAPPALDPDGRFVAVARDHELDILVVPVEGEWETEVPLPGRRCGEPALAWRSDQFLLAAVCGRELALVALETAP